MYICIYVCIYVYMQYMYTYVYMYVYMRIHIYIYIYRLLDYGLPQTPGGLRRLSEISVRTTQASCRYLWKTAFSHLLPWISAANRSPYPVLKSSLRRTRASKGMRVEPIHRASGAARSALRLPLASGDPAC